MLAEKFSGDNLKVEFVKNRKITELKIVSDVELVTFENEVKGQKKIVKKYRAGVSYDGQKEGDPTIWTMNHPCSDALIDTWGPDTDDWMGKPIPLIISGKDEFEYLQIDKLRIK